MKRMIMLSLVIVILAAFFASSAPDGLEKVAETLGFINAGVERTSVMTDYNVPVVKQAGLSTSLAGIVGVLICFISFAGVAFVLRSKHNLQA